MSLNIAMLIICADNNGQISGPYPLKVYVYA